MKPIQKTSIIDQVVDGLLEFIASDRVKIGDKMPTEQELCDMLKVGRSTVREGMRTLKALGYVEITPGRGTFLLRKTPEGKAQVTNWLENNKSQLDDLMEVRSALEVLSAKLAVQRATEDDLEHIYKTHQKFKNAYEFNISSDLAYYDELFHSQIMIATHNSVLISIGKQLTPHFRDYRLKTFRMQVNCDKAFYYHQKIVDFLLSHDEENCVKIMTGHLQFSMDDIINWINSDS